MQQLATIDRVSNFFRLFYLEHIIDSFRSIALKNETLNKKIEKFHVSRFLKSFLNPHPKSVTVFLFQAIWVNKSLSMM
jgi:hypothetical protein